MKNKLFITICTMMLIVSGFSFDKMFVQASTQSEIYSYTYNGQLYESDISEDDAWTKAMLDQVEQGNLTMEEVVEVEYSKWGSRDIIEVPQLVVPYASEKKFTGHAEWQPDTGRAYLPLQRVKVELYAHYSGFLPLKVDETYTNDDGNYVFDNYSVWSEIAINAFGGIWAAIKQTYSVRIYPESTTFRIGKDWLGVNLLDAIQDWSLGIIPNFFIYYVSSSTSVWFYESSGSFGTTKIPYSTTNDTNKSFYISQAMVMGQRFVEEVREVEINKFVTAIYPFGDMDSAFCWNIVMAIGGGTNDDHFDNWETILHEYGHFIQHNVGINNISPAEYVLYNPEHYSDDDHIASKSNGGKGNKSYGARLAWTEAWATVFSMVVQDHFMTGYYMEGQTLNDAGILNLSNAYLPSIGITGSDMYKYISYGPIANSGEGQEDAIIAFLWNLYHKSFFGQDGFWNTTTISGIYTLSDYARILDIQYPEYLEQFGIFMSKFTIAPKMFTSTYVPGQSVPPTFTWQVNGSQYNPNNQFRIIFYDIDGTQIYETGNVAFTLTPAISPNQNRRDCDVASYTLSQQEFEMAKANFKTSDIIRFGVKGYRTGSPVTGAYRSNIIPEMLGSSSLIFSPINNRSEYAVTGIKEAIFDGIIKIPSTYLFKPVTKIGTSAFANYQIVQVSIPKSIKSIDQNAFGSCTKLSTIQLPLSVSTIGANAFINCPSLTIYPEAINKSNGWDNNWNISNRPVVWGGENRQSYSDSVTLSSYNYPSQYNNFDPISKNISTQLGNQVTTNRLRCGVINYAGQSYLTLSAKNKDANKAYLEYYFTDYLIEVNYQLALWSSDESLIQNSSIRLEAFYDNQWTFVRSFSAASMSQSKDSLLDYSTKLREPTKAVRFIVETTQVTNDNNKGRVVIGDINVVHIKSNHVHEHTKYEKYSDTEHKSICYCGESTLRPHAVNVTIVIAGYRYGYCVDCGELGYLGEANQTGHASDIIATDIILGLNEIKYEYSTTTYIADNGIIVLSLEDVDKYLAGLIFSDYLNNYHFSNG